MAGKEKLYKNNLEEDLLAIWQAGVDGVAGDRLVREQVHATPTDLFLGEFSFKRANIGRLVVLGGGKAAAAMGAGLEEALGEEVCRQMQLAGQLNVPDKRMTPLKFIRCVPVRSGDENRPTKQAVQATERICHYVERLRPNDLCLFLLSGGSSNLVTFPRGLSIEEKHRLVSIVSSRGANITEMNRIRQFFSQIKGGQLAMASLAPMVTLAISDVPGDNPFYIGSGPTCFPNWKEVGALPDLASQLDYLQNNLLQMETSAREVMGNYLSLKEQKEYVPSLEEARHKGALFLQGLATRWQRENRSRQQKGTESLPLFPNHYYEVIGNNALAVDSAGIEAEKRGYNHVMDSSTKPEGEAEKIGRHLAHLALSAAKDKAINCLITGGEPIVKLPKSHGLGGRNQHLALAFWDELSGHLSEEKLEKFSFGFLSGATDGEDGPTDVSGAYFTSKKISEFFAKDSSKWRRIVQERLLQFDAYSFFEEFGGHLPAGEKVTNVGDLRIIVLPKEDETTANGLPEVG
ncbi:MAG: DUF4147 domain-containing protein [Pirellulaceae bacterium]|nr:DUF4147 domain-containing protein [Pirellulaceae bacterium]